MKSDLVERKDKRRKKKEERRKKKTIEEKIKREWEVSVLFMLLCSLFVLLDGKSAIFTNKFESGST